MTCIVTFSASKRRPRGPDWPAAPIRVPSSRRSYRRIQQAADAHDVVRRGGEGEDPVDERSASVAQLPQTANRFHPAEALFDELPFLLTDGVAGVPGRARIDRAASARRMLRDVRRDVGNRGSTLGPTVEPSDRITNVAEESVSVQVTISAAC